MKSAGKGQSKAKKGEQTEWISIDAKELEALKKDKKTYKKYYKINQKFIRKLKILSHFIHFVKMNRFEILQNKIRDVWELVGTQDQMVGLKENRWRLEK